MTPEQKKSKAQEDRTAARYGGQRNIMSGGGWLRKGDVRSDDFMIENKTLMNEDAKSFSIKAEVLQKLAKEAYMSGRIPILQFDLQKRPYVVLLEDDFLELIGEA